MAKVTRNQKVLRAVRFIVGLRDPVAHHPLMSYGLTEEVLDEGVQLMVEATMPKLSTSRSAVDPTLLARFDEFENRWYPITNATLTRHLPDVGEWLFNNLSQTKGYDLIVAVTTFTIRLGQLKDGSSPFGERGVQAFELLEQRGLSPEIFDAAQAMVKDVSEFSTAPRATLDLEEEERLVGRLWAWYLEWSAIARVIIKDRQALRRLGFLQRRGQAADEEDEAVEDDAVEDDAGTDDDAAAAHVVTPSNGAPAQGVDQA